MFVSNQPTFNPNITPGLNKPRVFIPSITLRNPRLSSLPAGSNVLLFGGGQSIYQGIKSFTGVYPTKTRYWDSGTSSWRSMNSSQGYRTSDAPVVYFALAFEQAYPDLNLYVVEQSKGGTGFQNGSGEWAVGNPQRTAFRQKTAEAVTELYARNADTYFLGTMWIQGSADMANESHANAYRSSLQALIDETAITSTVKSQWVSYLYPTEGMSFSFKNLVTDIQRDISDAVVDSSGVPLSSDNLHYEEAGSTQVGQRFFTRLEELGAIKVKAKVPEPPSLDTVWDFTQLTELPSEFSLTKLTPSFASDGMLLQQAGPEESNWNIRYMLGPVVDFDKYELVYDIENLDLNSYGVTSDGYQVSIFSGDSETLSCFRNGNTRYKGQSGPNFSNAYRLDLSRIRFKKTGTNMVISRTDLSTGDLVGSATISNFDLVDPQIFFDCSYSAHRIRQIKLEAL